MRTAPSSPTVRAPPRASTELPPPPAPPPPPSPSRIYSLALNRLLSSHGYPAELIDVCAGFDASSVIRGLAVDRESGALVQLSFSSHVAKASAHIVVASHSRRCHTPPHEAWGPREQPAGGRNVLLAFGGGHLWWAWPSLQP